MKIELRINLQLAAIVTFNIAELETSKIVSAAQAYV